MRNNCKITFHIINKTARQISKLHRISALLFFSDARLVVPRKEV